MKKPEEYLLEPYARILIPCDGSYSAEILEFPGCFAQGETPEIAMKNIEESAETWIELMLEQGSEIPEPFANQDYSGKIALRLPKSLHKKAIQCAERDGVSLNQFLLSAIAERVGAEGLFSKIMKKYESQVLIHNLFNITETAAPTNYANLEYK